MSFSCRKEKDAWDFLWTFADGAEPDDDEIGTAFDRLAQNFGLQRDLFSDYEIKAEKDRNWLAESYQALPPLSIGSFFIHGSHHEGPPPEDKIPLLIEAATAFGSGAHGTTSQCILAIEHIYNAGLKPKQILDMGCGSGILAAVAAKLWPNVPVYAADNDTECVVVTKRHIDANAIKNVLTFESDGYAAASRVWDFAPFDLVIANILAGPLIDMAQEQSRAVARGAFLILSGTLLEQAQRVLGAYTPHGFSLEKEFPDAEWMTLLLKKN